MKRLVISIVLAAALVIGPASGALAAGPETTVTVTAVPSFFGIEISPTTWTLNNVDGDGTGLLALDIIYYSNTVGDTTIFSNPVTTDEAWHALTNTSTVNINVAANMADFNGGSASAPMTNGSGTNGANAFAAWVCESGVDWTTKVVMDTSGSGTFWTSSSPGDDIDVAFAVETQDAAWADGETQTSDIVLTASAA